MEICINKCTTSVVIILFWILKHSCKKCRPGRCTLHIWYFSWCCGDCCKFVICHYPI